MCDALDRCYDVADDPESAVLDDLARRTGLVWSCGQCRWNNLTTATTCGQCSTHRYADLIPDDAEQRCGCGGMLEINRKNVHVDDATATGTVERVCDRCPAGSTHLWALDDSDYRMIFGRDFGSDD